LAKPRDPDLAALLEAVGHDAEAHAEPEHSPFAKRLGAALGEAVTALRAEGVIEVDDGHLELLVAEVTESGLDSRSPKQLVKKVIRSLIASDHVEEVYGTDDEISARLRRFLDSE